jgi:hypothetical protein
MAYRSRFPRVGAVIKSKQKLKVHGEHKSMNYPANLGGKHTLLNGPEKITLNHSKVPMYALQYLAPPIKDYMNFKTMSSNEVLLNLDNHLNLSDSELVGGMVELCSRKDKAVEVDWNEHPITQKCIEDLKER